MIEYIIKYQNNFVHSYLFENNFTTIIKLGINIHSLLLSDLFCHELDFDEWPQTHTYDKDCIIPYNGSIFNLRYKYQKLFGQLPVPNEDEIILDKTKVYKIKYTINLLPITGDNDTNLMDMLADTDQIDVFETKVVIDLIEFKW